LESLQNVWSPSFNIFLNTRNWNDYRVTSNILTSQFIAEHVSTIRYMFFDIVSTFFKELKSVFELKGDRAGIYNAAKMNNDEM
jgi:hypothetical protein